MPKAVPPAASISATVLSVVISPEGGRGRPRKGPSIICCEPRLCDQFNKRAHLPIVKACRHTPAFRIPKGSNRHET
jgi:hypothetical protein